MYTHFRKQGVFFVPSGRDKAWGNTKVYGAVFLVKDYFFYISLLDAFHACSKNKLTYNHVRDIHHRVNINVTPIKFNTISDLNRLLYREGIDTTVISYIGNSKHPKIKQRFLSSHNYRKVNGVYEEGFTKLFREVSHE